MPTPACGVVRGASPVSLDDVRAVVRDSLNTKVSFSLTSELFKKQPYRLHRLPGWDIFLKSAILFLLSVVYAP